MELQQFNKFLYLLQIMIKEMTLMIGLNLTFLILPTAFNSILYGASLHQSVKQYRLTWRIIIIMNHKK